MRVKGILIWYDTIQLPHYSTVILTYSCTHLVKYIAHVFFYYLFPQKCSQLNGSFRNITVRHNFSYLHHKINFFNCHFYQLIYGLIWIGFISSISLRNVSVLLAINFRKYRNWRLCPSVTCSFLLQS